ncbi:MAG: extracellular catalytic domain type 1 short-chain-length polyhydroxyalkanoate depolymerase [Planctomycetota bacterium]
MRLIPIFLLAACVARPDGLMEHEFGPQGARKTYELYVPESGRDPAPLVVALHRYTESGKIMAWMTGFNELADKEGFVVLYPDGPGRRFAFFDYQERDDVALILSMVEEVARKQPIDRRRIYVVGASNGGFMVHRLACLAPETFAAAAAVMSLMPRPLAERVPDGAPIPMLVIHGTRDRIVKPAAESLAGSDKTGVLPIEETVAYWVRRNGASAEAETTEVPDRDPDDGTRTVLRRYPGSAEVRDYRVEGGGHTWPGGKERAPRFIVGKTARDWSATEEIWTFFRTYSR